MSENEKIHTADCDKQEVYTDGIFYTCYCGAVAMNTVCGAKFRHREATQAAERRG